jgi:tetratricopeptide (TPR) repeat protein
MKALLVETQLRCPLTEYQSLLIKLNRNLNTLKEREAKYGGNAPLELLNQIEDHQKAIALTEQAIRGELSEAEWREALAPLNLSLAQTTNVFQVFIQSIPRPLIIGLGAALVIIIGLGIANLGPVQQTLFPTPTPTTTPLPFAPADKNETLILIATFHHTEGVVDTDPHNEIRRAIEAAIAELEVKNLRVEVEPTRLTGDDQAEAKKLGERYGASMVIWGVNTGVRVTVNFLNLKEPDYGAAAVQISETERTQLANPSTYARFITNDLPGQLTFLALFAVGQSYFTQTDYAAAIRVIDRAVAALSAQLVPPQGAAEAYFRLGWLYQYQDQKKQAIANYNQAIELDPKAVVAHNNRAIVYHQQGDYQQALADYGQAIELDPKYAPAYTNRGIAYSDQHDYQRAIADYDKAIELDPQLAPIYNNRGNAYKNLGDYQRAIADYDQAIKLDSNYVQAYNNRANTYSAQEDYQRAIADYTKAIELDPKYISSYTNRGIAYNQQGNYQQAISDYTKVIELDPKNAVAYTGRGLGYYNQGDYQQAIADYTKALELDPQNATAYYNRGLAYADQGDFQQALADYTKALELDPQDADVYYNRAWAYYNQGDYKPAISDYTKVLELEPQAADAYDNRGDAYAAQGDYQQAIADYTKAIELDPNYLSSWNGLCRVSSLMGSAPKGMNACEQAIKLAPDNGYLHDSRGLARALTGDYQGAIEDFKFFIEWSKQNNLYEQYGRKREAWIAELEAGRNPFDEATLEALRKE